MRIVWTIGDIHGIGPEIVLKSFLRLKDSGHTFVVAGSLKALEFYRDRFALPVQFETVNDGTALLCGRPEHADTLQVLSAGEPECIVPGKVSGQCGTIAMRSLQTAADLCKRGICNAMVTAPINKEAIALAGYANTGHTDYLAGYFGAPSPIMLFVDPVSSLRVALVTIHVPLLMVPPLIRTLDLDQFFLALAGSIRTDFHLPDPSIAVLGLNPHASDGGVMGNEEGTFIRPCIERLSPVMNIHGPFPADGFFGAKQYSSYDIVVAMYHDQGLLPFKVLAFDTGINVTLGLPIVRTSPDHGTGFDKAEKGIASERSFYEATLLALDIARNRMKTRPIS
jgi:4-hydroxythreonine-4-phosphate dehydrogenase